MRYKRFAIRLFNSAIFLFYDKIQHSQLKDLNRLESLIKFNVTDTDCHWNIRNMDVGFTSTLLLAQMPHY